MSEPVKQPQTAAQLEPLVRLPLKIRLKRSVRWTGLSADWRHTFDVMLPVGAIGTKGSGRFYEFRDHGTTEFLPFLWWAQISDCV